MSAQVSAERAVGRQLLVNSALALALAAMVDVFLHESAHAVAGLTLGVHPTIFHSSVSFAPQLPPSGQIVTAAAGPLFSLVFGAVVFALTRNAGHGFARLFWLWLGLISMQNFFGYALIAPFAGAGDSGKVLRLLDAPFAVFLVTCAVGIAGTFLLARLLAGQVIRYATTDDQLRRTVLFPWLIGTAFTVLLTLVCELFSRSGLGGAELVLVMVGSAATAIFAPLFVIFFRRLSAPADPLRLRQPVVPLVIAAVVTLLTVLVVAPGITV